MRFDFLCNSEFELKEMSLYCELMGKYSNAVLCENGIIAGALKTTAIGESTRRVLFPKTLSAINFAKSPEKPLKTSSSAFRFSGFTLSGFLHAFEKTSAECGDKTR